MNIKIHILAVSFIILLLVAMYAFQGSGPGETKKTEGYFVQISNASIGLNCLDKKGNILPQYADSNENSAYRNDSAPSLRRGNALVKISNACNGKEICELSVNSKELGITTAARCTKQLQVEYRCFSYDRLWLAKANEGERLTLNCQNRQH